MGRGERASAEVKSYLTLLLFAHQIDKITDYFKETLLKYGSPFPTTH